MNQKDSILIVEDEKNIASLIDKSLRQEGFHTIIAHDGERALQLAREWTPVFVVLDLMLPKMSGWEVCRRLREESDVPILMLTAKEGEIDRLFGFSLGADDYVVKPFSPRELIERVKAILRRTKNAPMLRKSETLFRQPDSGACKTQTHPKRQTHSAHPFGIQAAPDAHERARARFFPPRTTHQALPYFGRRGRSRCGRPHRKTSAKNRVQLSQSPSHPHRARRGISFCRNGRTRRSLA